MAMAAGLSNHERHMEAVQEKSPPPAPSPVTGLKYSSSPDLSVSSTESFLTLSARLTYLQTVQTEGRQAEAGRRGRTKVQSGGEGWV